MPEELNPDLCVIGGGPGGAALAAQAADHGLAVVLVEKGRLGGANLAAGAVASGALIAAAELHETLRRGPAIGVSGAPLQVNFAKVQEHVRATVEAAARAVSAGRLEALGVKVIAAEARFRDRRSIGAGDAVIRARRFAIATGSIPAMPAIPGLDTLEPLSVAAALEVSRKPSHLVVLGSDPHGLEIAQAYVRLGVDATVIDEGVALAGEDPELAAPILERLRAEGVRIRDGVKVVGVQKRKGGFRLTVAVGGDDIAVDGSHLLIMPGRAPNVAGLALDYAGIEHGPSGIVVDRQLRTANRHVYAIGDVIPGPASASRAEHHASRVLRSILGGAPAKGGEAAAPYVVSTDPGLARVGLGEAEARERFKRIRVLRIPFVENGLALAERTTAGMVKAVATERGRILGAAAAGRGAGEIVALWSLAMSGGLDLEAMKDFPAPCPSRAEMVRRVALALDGPGPAKAPRKGLGGVLRRFG